MEQLGKKLSGILLMAFALDRDRPRRMVRTTIPDLWPLPPSTLALLSVTERLGAQGVDAKLNATFASRFEFNGSRSAHESVSELLGGRDNTIP